MQSNLLNNARVKMSPQWDLHSSPYAPVARTQLFDIEETVESALDKLLVLPTLDGWGIDAAHLYRPKTYGISWPEHSRAVHTEIRAILADKLQLDDPKALRYQTLQSGGNYLILFLSPCPRPSSQWITELLPHGFNLHSLAQVAIALRLKLALLDNAAQYFVLPPIAYNSELYFAAQVQKDKPNKHGDYYVDALRAELYFSPVGDLSFELKGVCFRAQSESVGIHAEYGRLLIRDQQSLSLLGTVDAKRYGKMPYMRFAKQPYIGCQNHAENLIQQLLHNILTQAEINFSPRLFQASHRQLQFLEVPTPELKRHLILIDNLDRGDDEVVYREYLDYLQKALGAQEVITPQELSELSEDVNYLVINSSRKRNGSSITLETVDADGKLTRQYLNSTWQALKAAKQGKKDKLDYYSRLKVDLLLDFDRHAQRVFQGCNIDAFQHTKTDPETKIKSKVLKPLPTAKLEMIRSELWLKEAVLGFGTISGLKVEDGQFSLVSIRRPNMGAKRSSALYAAITPVSLRSGVLQIERPTLYEREQELRSCVAGMTKNCVGELRDSAFYLIDHQRKVVLRRYNSIRIPRLLGPADRCLLEAAENNEGMLNKRGAPDATPLPYYLTPKPSGHAPNCYQQLFIEQRNEQALLFCSRSSQPNQNMDKAVRVYNLIATDFDGNPTDVLAEPATELLLRTFTYDVVRYHEVSQSSLLEKIARIMLHN